MHTVKIVFVAANTNNPDRRSCNYRCSIQQLLAKIRSFLSIIYCQDINTSSLETCKTQKRALFCCKLGPSSHPRLQALGSCSWPKSYAPSPRSTVLTMTHRYCTTLPLPLISYLTRSTWQQPTTTKNKTT